MQINEKILLVLLLLGGFLLVAVGNKLLSRDNEIATMSIPHTPPTTKVQYHAGTATTMSMPQVSSPATRPSTNYHSISYNSSSRTPNSSIIGGGSLYTTSSSTMQSFGGNGSAGSATMSHSSNRHNNTSSVGGGIGSVSLSTRKSNTTITTQSSTSSAVMSSPIFSTTNSPFQQQQYSGWLYSQTMQSQTDDIEYYNQSRTRRKVYTPGVSETDGEGNYWDDITEQWLPIPGTTPKTGQTKIENGYLWIWNGKEWVQGPQQPGEDPSDDDPGLDFILDQWRSLYIAEFGDTPSSEQLQQYINWKLGKGIFTPYDAPIGNGILLLLLLSICLVGYKKVQNKSIQR